MIGATLSHYKIVEKLGSGGMGDVYVAEDTELGRQVALKVLPSEMAENEERRVRFKREARAIAALNHPNIVTVHSVEEDDGVHFITMELVRGKTLSELQPKTGFALSKFLEISAPLADAVAAAHQEGITHRDLKPDNVMLSDDGRVKVLDFGLAKPKAGLVSDASGSDLPTQHKTEEGRILGTVSYMSPEQAEGKPVDERSDIFSLGILYYEMLTGQRPFDGDTPASTLSAIIKVAPQSATELRPSIPRDLAKFLKRCLAKDPERRFQTCKDVRNELDEIKEALSTGELQVSAGSTPERKGLSVAWVIGGAAAVLIVGVVVGSLLRSPSSASDAGVPRLTNPLQVTSAIGVETNPTWSPEGGRIAYLSDQSGNLDIWVSQVSGGAAVNLTQDFTGRDQGPRWSPDGSQIAFKSERDGNGCFLMSALGGSVRRVVDVSGVGPPGDDPVWSPDGSMLGCSDVDGGRLFVTILTVATQEVERFDLPAQYSVTNLSWSPDGSRFAYVDAISSTAETTQLWIVGLNGGANVLTDGTTEVWSPMWSPDGHSLLYISNRGGSRDLWTQRLNEDAEPQGDSRAVTTGLGIQSASLRDDGSRIAYSRGGRFANAWRVPIFPDRAATWADAEQLTFDQAFIEFLALSPDGGRLVVNSNRSGFQDLWMLPAAGGEMKPLTNDPVPDWMPAWSPDGGEIAFYSGRSGNRDIWVMPSDGGPMRQLTTQTGGDIMPAWSPDGERIAYTSIRDGNYDIWVMSTTGEQQLRLTERGLVDNMPEWSSDGRWIAFQTAEDGENYIWRVPATGGDLEQMSETGGRLPHFTPDGDTIYYVGQRGTGNRGYWALSVQDRTERLVTDLSEKRGRPGGFALDTDGEYLYFTWEETLGDIWVMDVAWDE